MCCIQKCNEKPFKHLYCKKTSKIRAKQVKAIRFFSVFNIAASGCITNFLAFA
jgi:hypothetical protein